MQKIVWSFTVDEANYILSTLGARPFVEVAALVPRMKAEADQQIAQKAAPVAEAA